MAGTVAVSTASSTSKKVAKARKPSTHPPFNDMIVDAVKSLKERTGSSRHAILKYILVKYNLGDVNKANSYLKLALKKGVSSGALIQVKGAGASGSFKVLKEQKPSREIQKKPKTDNQLTKAQLIKKTTIKQTKEAITKKQTAKRTAAVKASKKATAKKPTAKRTAAVKASKKATAKKPVAKKIVLKKATKKPASKKSSQKTAKKPVAKKPARK